MNRTRYMLIGFALCAMLPRLLTECVGQIEKLRLEPANAQPAVVRVAINETSDIPHALVLSVEGKCDYSEDGKLFAALNNGQVLNQGAVIRTAEDARADLFFRRTGTAVRLQSGTEMRLEKMTRSLTNGKPVIHTLLDLRAGRIFTAVYSLVAGSTFEIRNAAGRSVMQGGGSKGRYIITADGTHVADTDSVAPPKATGETGITVITPGQKFNPKEGKMFALETPETLKALIDFDELASSAEQLSPPTESPRKP